MAFGDPVGSKWRPHADVYYYVDRLGARVGVLPATCFAGEHGLHEVGYEAVQFDDHVRIICKACNDPKSPRPDYYWALRPTSPIPDRAELDDRPYLALIRELADQRNRRGSRQAQHGA